MRGGGGGKWFILYQSDIYYSIWTNDLIPFFYLFHISGAGNQSRAKELKLKMSCGRKCFRCEKCLVVEKLQPRVSLGGKLFLLKNVTSENILRWKIPRGGKCLAVQKVVTIVRKWRKTSPTYTPTYSTNTIYFLFKKTWKGMNTYIHLLLLKSLNKALQRIWIL